MKKWGKRLGAALLALSMINLAPMSVDVQAEEVKAVKAVEVDVTDFGADPSGKYDSTEAVMAALEEAKTIEGEKVLNFPYGEYRFDKDHASTRVYHTSNTSSRSYPEKKISILLEEIEDLTIEGNDSTLLIYGDIMALAVVESSDIKMQNFVLDYKDADTIDISVVKTDVDENGKSYADIYVPAAYNYEISADGKHIEWQGEISEKTGKPYWTWNDADFCAYLVVYKGYDRTVIRATNKNASNPFAGVESIVPSGESTVRFTYESALPTDIVEGNIYQLSNSAWRQTAGAFFWESENLTVENIDVHYLSGFGWLTQMCKNVEFKGVDFLPREGSGKYTTSNADQLHVAGCGGYFKVTDCNFSMAHDDPINVHGTYMRVEEVIDAKTVRVKYIHGQQGGFQQFHEGDEVLFYSRTYLEEPDGQVETEPFIVESSVGPGQMYNGNKLDLVTEIVTFAEELPAETLVDLRKTVVKNNETQPLYVAENVTYTPAVTIKGNRMKSIPTRGILCTTRQEVLIEDNIFDNMAMASIYLSNDADDWYESGPIRNLTIRNNTFYIRPTGQSAVGTVSGVFIEPITIPAWAMNGGETTAKNPETPVHKNITIEGNTFHISNDNVVTANRVDGLTIKNNTIIHDDSSLAIRLDTKESLGIGKSQEIEVEVDETILAKDVFQFNDCQNVTVSGNTYDEGMNLNIKLDAKMTENDLILGANEQEVLTVNRNGGNRVTSADQIQLISSNPKVAYIDETGRLIGVKAGITKVKAYVEKNGALICSNEVSVTVGEELAEAFFITADKTFFENENDTTIITASKDLNVTYQILDPVTGQVSDKAVMTENTYTAKKDGVVLVKATAENGEKAELLMIHSFAVSYGSVTGLADGVSIVNETAQGPSFGETSVTINSVYNGNAMAENGTGSKTENIVSVAISEEMQNDLRIRVKATGLTPNNNGWGSSGIMLYTAEDNYFFTGKRGHYSGITTMSENEGVFSEASSGSGHTETTVTFELVIDKNNANHVIVRYLVDGATAWETLGTYDISHLRGDGKVMKLGFASWLNYGNVEFYPTFSEILIAKNSDVADGNMSAVSQKVFTKNHSAAVENPTSDGTTALWEDTVLIKPQSNGNGIWTSSRYVNNIVNLEIPSDMEEDLRLHVDAKGLVKRASGWNSSGVMLYTDLDNYLFVGKRNHANGVATMYEIAGNCEEGDGDSAANNLTDTTFEFVISGTTATVNYLDASGNWQKVKEFDVTHLQNGNMKLGLVAWLNGGEDFTPVYSNIRMARESVTSREQLMLKETESLYGAFENSRPEVSAVTIEEDVVNVGTTVHASVTANDVDGSVDSYLYLWTLETSDGSVETTYTVNEEYTPEKAGKLTVGVVCFDNYQKPANVACSVEKIVNTAMDSDATLNHLYLNGNKVENGEVYVPADVSYVRFSYDKAESHVETTIVGNETVTIPIGSNSAVMSLADIYTITYGDETYLITVHPVGNSDNALNALTVGNQSVDLDDEIKVGTDSYFVHVNDDKVPVCITAQEDVREIKVTRSYYEKEVEDQNGAANVFETEVEMLAGINAYYIYITAADGVSTREVKLYLFRDAYTDCKLESISLNGKNVESFEATKENYIVHVSADDAKELLVEVSAKDGQQTSITYENQRTEGTEATVELKTGLNEIIVTNVAKDIWSKHYYTLNVIVDSEDNAELLALTTDEVMEPTFEIDITSYELKNNTGKINVSAQAQVEDATVCMYMKDMSQKASAKGQLSKAFTLYEGDNCIIVEVTAVDGKTKKAYELNVKARGLVYASDVIAMSTLEGIASTDVQVGYGSISLDANVDGNGKIALVDENGDKVQFEKGLGAHASSEITYEFEDGHDFEYFEAYTGVDYAKYTYNASSVTFEVWVDGVKVYDSVDVIGGVTGATTPMQFVKVSVAGAREIKLITTDDGYNGYDHSEWADACFTRSLPENPNPVTPEPTESVTQIFDDVSQSWYTEYIQYVYDNGIMTGIEGTKHFAPNMNMTKAQVAQVLYNMEEKPVVINGTVFEELSDVKNGAWYANAVAWAYKEGVVTGDTDAKKFFPNEDVTREQLAVMMYRYAKYKGYNVDATSDFTGLVNADKVAAWAKDGMSWAVAAGLISGVEENGVKDLAPKGNATRAQMAAILQRFNKNVE